MIVSYAQRYRQFAAGLLLAVVMSAPLYGQARQGWRPGEPPPGFHVLEVRGEVALWRSETRDLRPLTVELTPVTNDEIRTGPDGYVRIGLEDGSQLEVFAGSRVQLGIPRASWMKMFELFLGQVRVLIEHVGGRPNPYSFSTPTAVLGVRGTLFDVGVDDTTATIVAVGDGAVQVENVLYQGQGVLVQKGYRTIVRPYQLPSKPERFTGYGGDFAAMAKQHGKAMDPRAGAMMSGSQPGMRTTGSGTMGMPTGGVLGMPGGGTMGKSGGTMPGMGGPQPKKKDPP